MNARWAFSLEDGTSHLLVDENDPFRARCGEQLSLVSVIEDHPSGPMCQDCELNFLAESSVSQPTPDKPTRANDVTIPVTCTTHSSGRGFCNLRVSKIGGDIVLDPHVAGACVIVLDEGAATALFDLLGQWLG